MSLYCVMPKADKAITKHSGYSSVDHLASSQHSKGGGMASDMAHLFVALV